MTAIATTDLSAVELTPVRISGFRADSIYYYLLLIIIYLLSTKLSARCKRAKVKLRPETRRIQFSEPLWTSFADSVALSLQRLCSVHFKHRHKL